MSAALDLDDTVAAGELRHRLALGLSLVDALTGMETPGVARVTLESIGPYRVDLPFEAHGPARHALRYAARVRKLVDRTVDAALDRRWIVRIESRDRTHVARRMRFDLAFANGQPDAAPSNIRPPWLWPGATYALPSTGTAIRGRVLRGPDPDTAVPIRWARVFATAPATTLVFAPANVVACGHGDDRGEFLLALGARLQAAAALTDPVDVRLWAFFPPPAPPVDPADPLDGLYLEEAALATVPDAVLRGDGIPAACTQRADKAISVRLGHTTGGAAATLLFP
ncbi:hypothetical protein BWI17_06245 [Betaproteobacteria bacterium GR16-43]|nr:hypothetical protein BWI17_06245 [Betaproteobacteria bacterium GR16-43]